MSSIIRLISTDKAVLYAKKNSLQQINCGPQPKAELENFSPTCGDNQTFFKNFS